MISGGTVDAPIGRDPKDRIRQAVVEEGEGKDAVTHYRVIDRFGHHTHVKMYFRNRTHPPNSCAYVAY